MQCERLYPVFLMYDSEGQLGAFGWSFQGQPYEGGKSIVSWYQINKDTFYVSHMWEFMIKIPIL